MKNSLYEKTVLFKIPKPTIFIEQILLRFPQGNILLRKTHEKWVEKTKIKIGLFYPSLFGFIKQHSDKIIKNAAG